MKNDLKSLKSFFCLFKTQWIPYAIATLVVASRNFIITYINACLLYTAPSPRDRTRSRMRSAA